MRDSLDRMLRALCLVSVAATCLSGLYLLFGTIRAPAYFPVIRFHAVAALPLLLCAPVLLLRRASGRQLAKATLVAAGLAALTGALLLLEQVADESFLYGVLEFIPRQGSDDSSMLGVGAVLAAALLVAARAAGKAPPLGLGAGALLFITAMGTGLVLVLEEPRTCNFDEDHSLSGAVAILLLLLAALPVRPPRQGARRWPLATAGVGLVLATALGWALLYQGEYDPYSSPDRADPHTRFATTPATRAEMLAPRKETIPEAWLGGSMRCGQAACHPIETRQWAGSSHRYALDNLIFRKVVSDMLAELGPESANACMNCHDPVRALAGTVTSTFARGMPTPTADGVTCAFCHSIVHRGGPGKNGIFTVAVARPYPGDTVEERERNLLLDPRAHSISMYRQPDVNDDKVCTPCHTLEMTRDTWASAHISLAIPHNPKQEISDANPGKHLGCVDCHMLISDDRERPLLVYDHEMPALNPDLPLYAVGPGSDAPAMKQAADYATRWLHGTLQRRDDEDEEDDEGEGEDPAALPAAGEAAGDPQRNLNRHAFAVLNRGRLLGVKVEARLRGGALEVKAKTTNQRSEHLYPTGSRDFRQVWQSLEVRDARGEVVARAGALDSAGRLDPAAHKLGATVLDTEGKPLRNHAVWRAASAKDVRAIPPGGAVTDSYSLILDEGARPPLSVTVRWNLRHAGVDFSAHIFGGDGTRFPVHVIGQGAAAVR